MYLRPALVAFVALGCAGRPVPSSAPPVDPCRALASAFRALSEPGRVERLRAMVAAADSPAAADVSARLAGRLEALSTGGAGLARDACPRSDAQRACLMTRSRALTTAVAGLDRVTPAGVVALLGELDAARAGLARCASPERAAMVVRSEPRASLPPGELDALTRALDGAYAAHLAGRYDEVRRALDDASARVGRGADPSDVVFAARARLADAPTSRRQARWVAGVCSSADAVSRARGDTLGHLESSLCELANDPDRRADPAFVDGFAALDDDDPLRVRAELTAAIRRDEHAQGRLRERPLDTARYLDAMPLLAEAIGASATDDRAGHQGWSDVVDQLYESAVARYGAASLEAARLQASRAWWRNMLSRPREAVALAVDARARIDALLGAGSVYSANPIEVQGAALRLTGGERSCELIDEALRVHAAHWGEDTRGQASRLSLSGWCHSRRGEMAVALAAYQHSVRIRVAHGEADSASVAHARISIGLLQAHLDDPEARASLDLGLARLTAVQSADDPDTASAERTAGEAYLALGDVALAVSHLEHALGVLRRSYPEASDVVCTARDKYARALLEAGRAREAAEALATAGSPPLVDAPVGSCRRLAALQATALRLAGDALGARRAAEAALAVEPASVEATIELAAIEVGERHLDAADARLRPLLSSLGDRGLVGTHTEGLARLVEATLLLARARPAEARAAINAAMPRLRARRPSPDFVAREAEGLRRHLGAPTGRR